MRKLWRYWLISVGGEDREVAQAPTQAPTPAQAQAPTQAPAPAGAEHKHQKEQSTD